MSTDTQAERLRTTLDERLAARDRRGAVLAALSALDEGMEVPTLYRDVLGPLMTDTGAAWQSGTQAVWEEHFASATVRTIVEAASARVMAALDLDGPRKRTAVLACPPEEQHDLGLRMASDLYLLAGWDVAYLGADTPESEIAEAARVLGAELVVLSSNTHFHRLRLRELVERLRDALPGVRVVVGGAAFAHDRDGWDDTEIVDLAGIAETPESA